jgi:hypothetical protein
MSPKCFSPSLAWLISPIHLYSGSPGWLTGISDLRHGKQSSCSIYLPHHTPSKPTCLLPPSPSSSGTGTSIPHYVQVKMSESSTFHSPHPHAPSYKSLNTPKFVFYYDWCHIVVINLGQLCHTLPLVHFSNVWINFWLFMTRVDELSSK